MGLILVFIALAVITALFRFFGLKYLKKIQADEAIQLQKVRSEQAISDDAQSEELVAILTAAAESVLHRGVIIRQIRFLQNSHDTAWARMGRLHVMSSHQLK